MVKKEVPEKDPHVTIAIDYLVNLKQGFHDITIVSREQIVEFLIKDHQLRYGYDIIQLPKQTYSPIDLLTPREMFDSKLIVVKTSNKGKNSSLEDCSFNVRIQEANLADIMPNKVNFAFVILPTEKELAFHEFMLWDEIKAGAKEIISKDNEFIEIIF